MRSGHPGEGSPRRERRGERGDKAKEKTVRRRERRIKQQRPGKRSLNLLSAPCPFLGCNGRFCRSAFSATSPHYVRARPFQPWAASDKFVSGCAVLLLSCYKCPSFKAVSTLRAPSNFQVPSFALCPAGKASHERFTAAMRRITYS